MPLCSFARVGRGGTAPTARPEPRRAADTQRHTGDSQRLRHGSGKQHRGLRSRHGDTHTPDRTEQRPSQITIGSARLFDFELFEIDVLEDAQRQRLHVVSFPILPPEHESHEYDTSARRPSCIDELTDLEEARVDLDEINHHLLGSYGHAHQPLRGMSARTLASFATNRKTETNRVEHLARFAAQRQNDVQSRLAFLQDPFEQR